jgi:succinate dehydrogenase hydrophobic anchor subunit
MTTVATTDTAPPSHRWLRAGLIFIAVLEFLDALSGVQNIFTDYHHPTAFLRFAQTLTSIKLALAPVIAGCRPGLCRNGQSPPRYPRTRRARARNVGA